MKVHCLLPLCCLALGFAQAQNTPPAITNVTYQSDAQNFTINYTLSDAENDDCEISLRVSFDGGKSFKPVAGAQGVGFPVQSGSRQVVFPKGELDDAAGGIPSVVRLIATDRKPVDIQQIVDEVDSNQVRAHITGVPFPRFYSADAANVALTKNYIETFLLQQGLNAERQEFQYSAYTAHNILARQPGLVNDSATYVVDAHFDGVSLTPGADDNASGVAGVMEAARVLSKYHFENSLRYISFDLEEVGLMGSQRYVQNGIPGFEQTKGVVNFEMIGYYSNQANTQSFPAGFELLFGAQSAAVQADSNRGNFIVNCSNTASAPLAAAFDTAATRYVPALRVISLPVPGTGTIAPDLRRSDHARFWDAGMEALMITDGANFRNTQYHQAGDSIGRLNMAFMTNVVKAAVGALAMLAKPLSASKVDVVALETSIAEHDHHHKTGCAMKVARTKGQVHIQLQNCNEDFGRGNIRIFSLDGRMHQSIDIADGAQKSFTLDAKLAAGTYIVVADNGHEAVNGKLVVE